MHCPVAMTERTIAADGVVKARSTEA
jgi:hypothetical protein